MRISDWSSDVCSSDLPAEVEDVAQEAFIKAYRALPQFRGDSAFYTWLYRIAINTARNWQVSSGRRPSTLNVIETEDGETFSQIDNLTDIRTPESVLASREIVETVNEIGRASSRERACQYVSISVVSVALKKKKKRNT